MGGGVGGGEGVRVGNGWGRQVIVGDGCILFGMHFSKLKKCMST